MAQYNLAWFVVLLPLLGAGASFLAESARRAAQICLAFCGLGMMLALIVLGARLKAPLASPFDAEITFFAMSPPEGTVFATRFQPQIGIHVDSLAAAFGAAVSFIVVLLQAQALTSLRGDAGQRRFFWSSSLLAFAALGFVFSPNLFDSLFMWVFGSAAIYLMAAHWWDHQDAAAPARHVFVALQVVDIALLLGVVVVFVKFGVFTSQLSAPAGQTVVDPFNFNTLAQSAGATLQGAVGGAGLRTLAVLAAVFIFAGVFRAAQFPFHVWMAEMATSPVQALGLAGATGGLVGVYLLARVYPLLLNSPHSLTAVALLGGFTAVVCAIVALAQRDILRIGALAAVAQLGLSLAALGTGGYSAAMFVLFTSVFFVPLYLIAAGNVVRVYRTRNIHETGGAWSRMRWSAVALTVWAAGAGGLGLTTYYALSSAFANAAPNGGHVAGLARVVIAALIATAGLLTALFAFRVAVTVCAGEVTRRRGFQHERVGEVEKPLRRTTIVAILAAVASVLVGLPGIQPVHAGRISIPGLTFSHFVFFGSVRPSLPVDAVALLLSLLVLVIGAGAALLLFAPARRQRTAAMTSRFEPLVRAAARGFFVERAAHRVGIPFLAAGRMAARFDETVLDGVTDAAAESTGVIAATVTRVRTLNQSLYLAGGLLMIAVLTLLSLLAATGHLWVHSV